MKETQIQSLGQKDPLEKEMASHSSILAWETPCTEDKMARRHHQFNGHKIEQTLEDSGGQGSLACCSAWSHKEWDMT